MRFGSIYTLGKEVQGFIMKKGLVLTCIITVAVIAMDAAPVPAAQNASPHAFIAILKILMAGIHPPLRESQASEVGTGSQTYNPDDIEGHPGILLLAEGRRRIHPAGGKERPADKADDDIPGESPVDTDLDGVPDHLDSCPDTPRGASVNEQGCWVITGAHFDAGKWHITQGLHPVLDGIVEVLKGNPSLRVEIQGHTDNTGSEAHNLVLSHKRACTVMEYLVGKGVEGTRLFAGGYGSSKPVATNKTSQGRAKNRRVELVPIR
jgi:outer membrane protein OmpA-like peptidoglycan-associated protein